MFGFSQPKVPQINAEDVLHAIQEKKDVLLLDVRTKDEVGRGKIENSINIPVDEVEKRIESEFPNKDATIYVYCLSGSRSTIAVDQMIKMGYKNVFSMTSGLLAWRSKNLPLLS